MTGIWSSEDLKQAFIEISKKYYWTNRCNRRCQPAPQRHMMKGVRWVTQSIMKITFVIFKCSSLQVSGHSTAHSLFSLHSTHTVGWQVYYQFYTSALQKKKESQHTIHNQREGHSEFQPYFKTVVTFWTNTILLTNVYKITDRQIHYQ